MKTVLMSTMLIIFSIQVLAQNKKEWKPFHYEDRIDTMGRLVRDKVWHKPPAIKITDKTWKDAIAVIRKYSKWECLGGQAGIEYWDKGGVTRESHCVLRTDTSFVEITTTWDEKRGSVIYGDWICYVYHYKGADIMAYTIIKPKGNIWHYILKNSSSENEMPETNTPEGRAAYGKVWKRK